MKRLLLPVLLLLAHTGFTQTYFQQRVDTKIDVRLDDRKHFLHGFEELSYTNNSPDTLRYLYLHLWPNAYSSDRTRFTEQQVSQGTTTFYHSKPADRGYIDSLDLRVDGQPVTPYSADGLPDIARIDLPAPLLPGKSIKIETPFRVKIPKVFSRMGHTNQAYYISQWFPKPAVYDTKGWHPLPYTDQGEFYSEVGAYDVSITLPSNYVVMATGNCENASENAWLDSLSKLTFSTTSRSNSKKWRDSVNRFPTSATTFKTLRFTENNVHDFAWFADKRFLIRKDTLTVPAAIGIPAHPVTVYAAFLPSGKSAWANATDYLKTTVRYLSEHVGPYPYNTAKAVEGDLRAGGGMEYPTVTIIDKTASSSLLKRVIIHEVGHNWFYGLLATNERDNAWMDEGVNTFYEQKIVNSTDSSTSSNRFSASRDSSMTARRTPGRLRKISTEDVLYLNNAAGRSDQALSNSSSAFTELNYGVDVYYKTAMLLNWLEGYMGETAFEAAMKDYYAQWHYKHPYPEDMQAAFARHSVKPLDWFFNGALTTEIGVDFAVKRARTNTSGTTLRIKNNSDFPAPVRINAYRDGQLVDSIWSLPFAKDTTLIMPATNSSTWRVGSEIPDYYALNNRYRSSGLLHNKSFRFKIGGGYGPKEASEIYLLPAVGYNIYDGFMAGLLIHNLSLPENRFRYILAPMYGTQSKDFVGAGSLGYWIYPNHTFKEIVPQVDVKTFHYNRTSFNIPTELKARYIKVAPSISFVLKNASPLSPVTRTILLKGYSIWEEAFDFKRDATDSLYKPTIGATAQNNYGLLRYTHNNARTFNPFSYVLEGQLGADFAKLSAEGRLRIDYNLKGKGLYLRGYAGKFITINSNPGLTDRYWLTGTYTGANDYLYDGTYIGRNERHRIESRQVTIAEGGGKLNTPLYGFPLGRSDNWLIGINIKTDIPRIKLPIRLYFDAITYADAAKISPSASTILYSGGIELHALKDVFLLHIPLLMSRDYKDYITSFHADDKLNNTISFSIQLQNINWLRLVSGGLKLAM